VTKLVETQHDEFMQTIIDAGKDFLTTDKTQLIRVVSHFDTDGLCAAVILQEALEREGYTCTLTNEPHLNDDNLAEIAKEEFSTIIFTDIGANKIEEFSKLFKEKAVIVLDHHSPGEVAQIDGVIHINPHISGITERNSISGAGVVYFFALGMNAKTET